MIPDERQEEFPFAASVVCVEEIDVFLYELLAPLPEADVEEPEDHVEEGDDGQDEEPEPREGVHLLHEQVDGQHALERVSLNVLQLSNLEIAHGDSRKFVQVLPGPPGRQDVDDLESVRAEVDLQELGQHEELSHDVGEVEDLAEEVEARQIRALSSAEHEADARDFLSDADQDVVLVLFVRPQPRVDEDGDVSNVLLSLSRRRHQALFRHPDDLRDVDSGVRLHLFPDDVWDFEQQRLEEKQNRHPSVEADVPRESLVDLHGNGLVHRDVVHVADEAVVLGVALVRVGEVGGVPAVDGVAHVVLGPCESGEGDEDAD